jgi:hypothetical protein
LNSLETSTFFLHFLKFSEMAQSSKTGSSKNAPKFSTLELFPPSAFMVGKWVNSATFNNSALDYTGICQSIGWNDAMGFHCTWYHDPYALFWFTATKTGGTIVGTFEGRTIVISQNAIGKALGVKAEGKEYSKSWEQVLTSRVDEELYGTSRGTEDVANFLKASRMKPKYKMLHNLLFRIIFQR